jgi:creatinine amidohydrolase
MIAGNEIGGSMKKLLLLCCILAFLIPIGSAQVAVPGQGVAGMNVNNVVELNLLTQSEIADKIKNGWTSIFIPTGGTEIRGPHAVIGVHSILATHRAIEAAKRLGKTIVAPTLPFAVSATGGPNAANWQKFLADGTTAPDVGAIQVPADVFKGIQQGAVESAAYMGFTDIFLMGDHGGGQDQMRQVVQESNAREDFAARGIRLYYVGDFYQKTHDDIDMYMCNHNLPIAGHGGMMETAEMMYWEPSQFAYVRPNYKTIPYSGNSDQAIEGCKERLSARASGGAGAARGGGGAAAAGRGAAGGRGAGGGAAAAGGGGRGAGGGAGARGPTVYPTGNPHPSTKAIGKDLAEIGITNTVNQVKALLAEKKGNQ